MNRFRQFAAISLLLVFAAPTSAADQVSGGVWHDALRDRDMPVRV